MSIFNSLLLKLYNSVENINFISDILFYERYPDKLFYIYNNQIFSFSVKNNNADILNEIYDIIFANNRLQDIDRNNLKTVLYKNSALDFSYYSEELQKRFRMHVFLSNRNINLVMRPITNKIFTLKELGFNPVIITYLKNMENGLFIISGPTGSGKTTTAIALLNEFNHLYSKHILTIEDPIEYDIVPVKSLITQREIGVDTSSFALGLKNALRARPHILFVGEIRDSETASLVLQASMTGHLVITTIHASSIVESLKRFIGLFPAENEYTIKQQLAHCLTGAISQRLIYEQTKTNKLLYEYLRFDIRASSIVKQDVKQYPHLEDVIREQKLTKPFSMID